MTVSFGGRASSVRFEGVTKAFGEVVAVNAISFVVEAGSLATLLGPSGCGKTTTLRLVAGLELATAGRILIGDDDVTGLPATRRDVSMVFQSYALFPHMTVIENVAYGFVVSGTPKAEAHAKAELGLELVGLKGYGPRLPSELSGGQQQRVAVARALVLEPQVLLFDEPLSNLDAKLRRRVREEIRDIQQSLGLTVVYVTHDQEEALAVSDKVIVMRNAEIAQEGKPRELYEQPADRFVADFIGDANMVSADILSVDGTHARVSIGGVEVQVPSRGLPVGPVQTAIRPESVLLDTQGGEGLAGTVLKTAYLGKHMEYTVDSPVGELFVVDERVHAPLAPGTGVTIRFGDRIALVVG
ncbi:Fe-ABC transporter, ATP-binding protein [alpha proteobacterium BAL199]|jgi:iron(III) transport system ATP-binding protein|nr:Fe-ABC transporter, ATP-binding protein [alpha proteobacterium BAL199]